MANFGDEDISVKKDIQATKESVAVVKEREDRIRLVKEKQNEERHRKLEELKAQALAAQKFREQKEEERRRRIDDLRSRDTDRRTQVEERKRAIMEADRERREYLLRKNQDREARFETKRRNERSSIVFAFGSSTPRMLDPGEMGTVSPSNFWNHRRATSISNIAYSGAPLTRRSSEREISDAPKKRAASASGLDRQREDRRQVSTSMYEVFNWGYANDKEHQPQQQQQQHHHHQYTTLNKKLPLTIAGPHINIDEPPSTAPPSSSFSSLTTTTHSNNCRKEGNNNNSTTDSPQVITYRSVARRKTDLMPTLPSPRDGSNYGSRSSLNSHSHTPRSPGRAMSMTRLDQLARPVRRNGEHISAIIERERRHQETFNNLASLSPSTNLFPPTDNTITTTNTTNNNKSSAKKSMSRSMTHLAAGSNKQNTNINNYNKHKKSSITTEDAATLSPSSSRPLKKGAASKSMCHLATTTATPTTATTSFTNKIKQTANKIVAKVMATKIDKSKDKKNEQIEKSGKTNVSGLRSGEVTPGGTISSRPNSQMSTSTSISVVSRRTTSATTPRKPRPISIAVTGISLQNGNTNIQDVSNKMKQEKPPLPKPATASALNKRPQTAPIMSRSLGPTDLVRPQRPDRHNKMNRKDTPKTEATPIQSPGPEKENKIFIQTITNDETISVTQTVNDGNLIDDQQPIDAVESVVTVKNGIDADKMLIDVNESVANNIVNREENEIVDNNNEVVIVKEIKEIKKSIVEENIKDSLIEKELLLTEQSTNDNIKQGQEKVIKEKKNIDKQQETVINNDVIEEFKDISDMSASMIAKSRITTEEEAKAALAERRRLAREEAERQAELERLRIEAESEAEQQRQIEEEERLRALEQEALHLAEEQRKAEEERLAQAIEEAKKREEEERLRREEEAKQKVEREEQERKAREEAEKQRIEMAERLKKEELEREMRRKRVEAIMSRTRAKGSIGGTPTKGNGDDKNSDDNGKDLIKDDQQSETNLTSENQSNDIPTTNDQQMQQQEVQQQQSQQIQESMNLESKELNYEQSVTDRENSLLGSFSHMMIVDKNVNNRANNINFHDNMLIDTNPKVLTDNSVVTTITNRETTTVNTTENGYKNNGVDNVINTVDLTNNVLDTKIMNVIQQENTKTEQLIDFDSLPSSQQIEDVYNFNNNNDRSITTTSSTLVTADSQENRGEEAPRFSLRVHEV